MLKFGNKEFRNLQEQVKKNMDDILFILQEEGVLNEFGIKVVGQESTIADMPTVADYKEDNPDWSYGDAYAIGTEEPYELYILTRANGTHPNDYWFNIGTFPAPGPQGPKGEQGDVGPQGPTGNPGADGVSPQLGVGNVVVETLESDQDATVAITESGTLANPIWNFNFGIPKGQDGSSLTSVTWGSISGSIANQTDLIDLVQGRVKKVTTTGSRRVYGVDDSGNQAVYTLGSDIVTPVNLSGYAQTSVANIYTEEQHMTKGIAFEASSVDFIKNDGENFYNYVLPYASGTIALSENFGGSYSGSYWTSLKINGTTKQIPQGGGTGGNAEWGSISGTLSNQTDLMSKFSEYATVASVNQQFSDFESATSQFVLGISEEDRRYAADVASIALSSANTYTDTSISGLSSIYAQISDIPTKTSELVNDSGFITSSALTGYATESWVSSNFLSIGTPISTQAVWGSITGNLSDQTDLVNELAQYAKVTDLSNYTPLSEMSLYATISAVSSAISSLDYASVHALSENTIIPDITGLASETYVNNSISALSSVYAPIGDYATTSELSSAISGVNSTISSLDYLSVGALSANTVIPTIPGAQSGITLSGGYYGLSTTIPYGKIFTGPINFSSQVDFHYSTSFYGHVRFSSNATFMRSVCFGGSAIYNGSTITNGLRLDLPSQSGSLALISDIDSAISGLSSVYAPLSDYASQSWVSANFLSIGAIPSISGYAELSGNNVFTGSNVFSYPAGIYANRINLGQPYVPGETDNAGYLERNLSNVILSTSGRFNVYANSGITFHPIYGSGWYAFPSVSPAYGTSEIIATQEWASSNFLSSGYVPSTISGYASETWTFTLSDNTTVTKTILVG